MQPFVLFGSSGRARTADLVINSHPLYQLSYRGMYRGAYTNQLSVRGQGYGEKSFKFIDPLSAWCQIKYQEQVIGDPSDRVSDKRGLPLLDTITALGSITCC